MLDFPWFGPDMSLSAVRQWLRSRVAAGASVSYKALTGFANYRSANGLTIKAAKTGPVFRNNL
jgi:hypothetical protein